jgi:hypothetical protein
MEPQAIFNRSFTVISRFRKNLSMESVYNGLHLWVTWPQY